MKKIEKLLKTFVEQTEDWQISMKARLGKKYNSQTDYISECEISELEEWMDDCDLWGKFYDWLKNQKL